MESVGCLRASWCRVHNAMDMYICANCYLLVSLVVLNLLGGGGFNCQTGRRDDKQNSSIIVTIVALKLGEVKCICCIRKVEGSVCVW
jgi:hypothetical protein